MSQKNRVRGIPFESPVRAVGITRSEALALEEIMFSRARMADKRAAVYRKFQPNLHGGRYSASYGGSAIERADERVHGVYIAWWGPGDIDKSN